MQGITAYSAYLPAHRLDRSDIGAVLGLPGRPGRRVVAGYDEDATTMAVAAGLDAVRLRQPRAVWLATTRPPYLEKTNAALVHAALGLGTDVGAYDVGGGLRSGVGALLAAQGSDGLALLSDIRIGLPESADESGGADGAAAFAFGRDAVIAEVLATASATLEVLDRWRFPESTAVEVWDDRFAAAALTGPALDTAAAAMEQAAITSADHLVVATANPRLAAALTRELGARPAPVAAELGFTGVAHAGLLLADVLDRAAPDETILLVAVADGVDALVLRTTARLPESRAPVPVATQLAGGLRVAYSSYLTWRGLLDRQPPRRPDPQGPAAPPSLRDSPWKHALVGSRCTVCGQMHVPPQRVCVSCGAADQSEPERIVDRAGTVATFSVDRLTYTPSPPMVTAVVDIDGGGRFVVELTDLDAGDAEIGLRVRPTFRRLHTSEGIHNYFWKMRPAKEPHGE